MLNHEETPDAHAGDGTTESSQGSGDPAELFSNPLISSYVDDPRFVPRTWLIDRIWDALRHPDTRFVLLIAEPGAGKTTVMSELARLHPEAPRYFIRRDSVTALRGGDARTFLFSVGHQLAHLHPALFHPGRLEVVVRQRAERISAGGRVVGIHAEDLRASPFYTTSLKVSQQAGMVEGDFVAISARSVTPEPRILELSNLQYLALLDPASVLAEIDPDARIIILVDALDEVRYGPRGDTVLSWLAASPDLPSNVRFVLTSRPDADILRSFRHAKGEQIVEVTVDTSVTDVGGHIRDDLKQFMKRLTAESGVAQALQDHGVESNTLIRGTIEKAAGNFQYVSAFARGLDHLLSHGPEAELAALLRLAGVPSGISGLYRFFLGRVKDAADRAPTLISTGPMDEPIERPAWSALYRPILSVLAVAYEPLSAEQLQGYAAVPVQELPRALEDLSQFLDPLPDRRYRLYHATFSEFLTSPAPTSSADAFHVDAAAWHGLVAGRLTRANANWLQTTDRYALAHTASHLIAAISAVSDTAARQRLLTALSAVLGNFGFLERKVALLGVDMLLQDFQSALGHHASPELQESYNVIVREAQNLREWKPREHAAYFGQQVRNRASLMGNMSLRSAAEERLDDLHTAHLLINWKVGGESPELMRTVLGHDDWVTDVAVTPDGKFIASACLDNYVRIIHFATGSQTRLLPKHPSGVTSVSVSPNGRLAASGDLDGVVRIWEIDAETVIADLRIGDSAIRDVAFTADGHYLAMSSGSELKLWNTSTAEVVSLQDAGSVTTMASTRSGHLVTGGVEGDVAIWDLASGEVIDYRGSSTNDRVVGLCVTSDDRRLVSVSTGGHLVIEELTTNGQSRTLDEYRPSLGLALSPDDRYAYVATAVGHIHVWDLGTGERVKVMTGHSEEVEGVAVTEDGKALVSCARDLSVRVWATPGDGQWTSLGGPDVAAEGHASRVYSVTMTPDGAQVLSGSHDWTAKVWDVHTGTLVHDLSTAAGWARCIAVTPNSQYAFIGYSSGQIMAWNLLSGEMEQSVVTADGPRDLAISPDGLLLVAGASDEAGSIQLWAVESGATTILGVHGCPVNAVLITLDGQRVLSAGEDRTVRVWDIASALVELTLVPYDDERDSLGQFLAGKFSMTQGFAGDISALALGGHGNLVLSSTLTGDVRISDVRTGAEVAVLRGHTGPVTGIATFADGTFAVTSSLDRSIRVWNVESQTAVAIMDADSPLACVAIGRDQRTAVAGDWAGGVYCVTLATS